MLATFLGSGVNLKAIWKEIFEMWQSVTPELIALLPNLLKPNGKKHHNKHSLKPQSTSSMLLSAFFSLFMQTILSNVKVHQ